MNILIALTMDARTDYLRDMATSTLTKLLGQDNDNEARHLREHLFVLNHTYNLIIEYTDTTDGSIRLVQCINTSFINALLFLCLQHDTENVLIDCYMIFLALLSTKKS